MDNNQDDIKNFVNRFKKYIKFIIINSSINYSKKIKLRRKREIELDDIDNLVGMEDVDDKVNNKDFRLEFISDKYIKEITSALTIREKIIIEDFVNDIPSKETAIKLSTSVNSVDVMRNRAKNKIKRKLREKDEK
ncbi:MAG: sigma-70 family RNA polymerase sigma factor [Clostridia bacterium]|nr:sigma-70 family RNA polymerase sigma factor [Clostridia bacterium]